MRIVASWKKEINKPYKRPRIWIPGTVHILHKNSRDKPDVPVCMQKSCFGSWPPGPQAIWLRGAEPFYLFAAFHCGVYSLGQAQKCGLPNLCCPLQSTHWAWLSTQTLLLVNGVHFLSTKKILWLRNNLVPWYSVNEI